MFKKLAKQNHSDAVAEGMKRLKKELEQKDETQTEITDIWKKVKIAVRDLPTGKTELQEISNWAKEVTVAHANEYWDKKESILEKIRLWENRSSIIIDESKDNGRIESMVPKKLTKKLTKKLLQQNSMSSGKS